MLQNHLHASFLSEHLQCQEFLAEHLLGSCDEFHIETAPGCFANQPGKALEQLVRSRPASLWILYQSSEAMQRWFQSRNLNCIVFGSTYDGVNYPSVDQDYRAVCRHAAGTLLGRGHRRLAIILPRTRRPGDQASLEGFLEGLTTSPHQDLEHEIVVHDETVHGICKAADSLLAHRTRCTAWFILNAQTYLTILSHLGVRRVAVGEQVSLLCRNSDPFFNALVPTVAHYARNVTRMNQRLLELVQQQTCGAPLLGGRWLISSEFCDGASLARLK